MRLANRLLITILGITITTVAHAEQQSTSGSVNANGPAGATPTGGAVTETIDWAAASALPSETGEFILLRRGSEEGLLTQLSDGSGQAEATLFTLDKSKPLSPSSDVFIDAGNRYFFRAGHNTNTHALAAMTKQGDLVVINAEDNFTRSLSDAAPLRNDWILAAGGLFHLSANHDLSNLSLRTSDTFPAHLISVGDRVIYVDRHPEYGVELFATDGTAKGTGMLLDINDQGYGQGRTRNSAPALDHAGRINNRIVFPAVDASITASGTAQYNLWSSDGTAEGTLRLPTGGFYANFSDFIEFKGRLYVTARPSGNGDHVLYSTDGTPGGTRALASTPSLIKAAGGDPNKTSALLGEPTRVGNRLIVPLLGFPLGADRGNPLFEISANGELKYLSETSENIGNLSSRLRQTGLSAGGVLLYTGIARKELPTFRTSVTVIRSVDPDSGDTKVIYELRPVERFTWLPNVPRRMPKADAVVFLTQFPTGSSRDLIVTDGTAVGTQSLSQSASAGALPHISVFAIGDRRIAWTEHHLFFAYDPSQAKVTTLFDPITTYRSRPGNTVLGTVQLEFGRPTGAR